jgi:microcystin-dependent protein
VKNKIRAWIGLVFVLNFGISFLLYMSHPTLQSPISIHQTAAQAALQKVPARMVSMPGMVVAFAGATQPDWCLFTYGQSLLRADYPALFSAIGTTYGAADGTHFNAPNIKGRTIFGKDDMGGVAADRITLAGSGVTGTSLGAAGGSEFMQQHTHTQNSHSHTGTIANQYTLYVGLGAAELALSPVEAFEGNAALTGANFSTAGTVAVNQNAGTGASQNLPPAIIMNYCITI